MNPNFCSIPAVISAGLILSQIISVLQVYLSNIRYYRKLSLLHAAGYLTVPHLRVMESLKSFETAFMGGLFFSLTVGLCLTLLSFGAAWLWDRIFSRKKNALYPFVIFWIACLILANIQGFLPMVTLCFLLIPPAVFGLSLKCLPPQSNNPKPGRMLLFHVICLILLALMGVRQMNPDMFSLIRDKMLLSNSVGIGLNNAYYRYTLYAAQVFKNLYQDQLRTCRISGEFPEKDRVKQQLARYDWLSIENELTDLEISANGKELIFRHGEKEILRSDSSDFFKNTGKILKTFSEKCDYYTFFRTFTFLSLLLVSGLSIWMILYLPIRILCGICLKKKFVSVSALIICFACGAVLIFFSQPEAIGRVERKELDQMLHSENLSEKIKALQYIRYKKMEIADFHVHNIMAASPHVPERYELVRTLSVSRSPDTWAVTLALTDDPQINVAYRAFHALGARRDSRAVEEILKKIPLSDEWYIQFYAYKALRNLGWRQTVSN
ncbi:MAG: HEAT repeat domain-containing protein [Desulfococcaceae bacterium]